MSFIAWWCELADWRPSDESNSISQRVRPTA